MKTTIPAATISRLPVYLRCLDDLPRSVATCSSDQLAAIAGVNSAQVRKDLSYLGSYGVRGVGYHVGDLSSQIKKALGLTRGYRVVIIGAGNLGSALAGYGGFEAWGFEVAGLVDIDPAKVGTVLNGAAVEHLDDLERICRERAVAIGIIATPAGAAQEVADRLVEAGVSAILNFAPAVLNARPGVDVRRVDLSTELQILTFHLQNR
ncbi:MAG: redox-sensing transcriptional repressor Rex [Actinobacteria bacterium]|nr:MAG: redox-sensing transcriptional repressor Rex [Actinomycetota bacterium]